MNAGRISAVMPPSPDTTSPVRRRSNGLRTRAEIIAAAERRFAERGFQDTRLGDVAADVGIRRPSLSYHFADKHELYTAVLQEVFADWSEALPGGGRVVERLEAAMASWVDFVAERPSAARLLLRELANAQPERIAAFLRTGGAPIEWFETVIEEGAASGELHPEVEPRRFMSLMAAIAVVQFAAIPWLSVRAPEDPHERAELEKRKHEILLVARTLLGYEHEPGATRPGRARASAATEDRR
jgi:TetR/AcrR family transcriptional regulator